MLLKILKPDSTFSSLKKLKLFLNSMTWVLIFILIKCHFSYAVHMDLSVREYTLDGTNFITLTDFNFYQVKEAIKSQFQILILSVYS